MQLYMSRENRTLLTVLEKQDTEASSTHGLWVSNQYICASRMYNCHTGPVIPCVYMNIFI